MFECLSGEIARLISLFGFKVEVLEQVWLEMIPAFKEDIWNDDSGCLVDSSAEATSKSY